MITRYKFVVNSREGGNSFYAARTGLVCDNVANFEVRLILAN